MEISVEDEINQITSSQPHLVILGAGASLAALPNGDKNGKQLPLMNNFVQTLHLNELIAKSSLKFSSNNFEDIYSEIHSSNQSEDLRKEIENAVYSYFKSLELPDEPTIYDYLVLSLRGKDFIATFNWDPLLVQAVSRNGLHFKMPQLLFLHGNVGIGFCEKCNIKEINSENCNECGETLPHAKLLYPIKQKDYQENEFIAREWSELANQLESTFMVSIFGYGAPASDVSAMDIFKRAWRNQEDRDMEQVEIIDIRDENELCRTWDFFINTHHYDIVNDYYSSWIANHPRRTGEAYYNQYCLAAYIEVNPCPNVSNFEELWSWFNELKQAEDKASEG